MPEDITAENMGRELAELGAPESVEGVVVDENVAQMQRFLRAYMANDSLPACYIAAFGNEHNLSDSALAARAKKTLAGEAFRMALSRAAEKSGAIMADSAKRIHDLTIKMFVEPAEQAAEQAAAEVENMPAAERDNMLRAFLTAEKKPSFMTIKDTKTLMEMVTAMREAYGLADEARRSVNIVKIAVINSDSKRASQSWNFSMNPSEWVWDDTAQMALHQPSVGAGREQVLQETGATDSCRCPYARRQGFSGAVCYGVEVYGNANTAG